MTDKGQVLDMVRAGTISEAEGQRLIDALHVEQSEWRVLIDPFDRFSTTTAWALAVVVFVACLVISQLGFRFDGALDMHLVRGVPPWRVTLIDAANAVGVSAAVLWLASLVVARRGRFRDFLLAVCIARAPLIVTGLLLYWLLPPAQQVIAQAVAGSLSLRALISGLLALPLFVWFVVLLYHGFVYASGLKGTKAGITFTVAAMVAELVTKLVLMAVVYLR